MRERWRRSLPTVVMAVAGVACVAPAEDTRLGSGPEACEPVGVALSVGGTAPPAHLFGQVADASLLPDSGIAVVDRQAHQLHVFGPDGRVLEALGGEGEGPGELEDPIAVDVADDRVLVWDWAQSRVTAFEVGNGEVGTFPVRAQMNPTHHFGVTTDGFMVGTVTGDMLGAERSGRFWTRNLSVVLVDAAAAALDTVLEVPDEIVGWVDESVRRTGSPIFSPRADVTISGEYVYWTRGDSATVLRARTDADRRAGRVDTLRWDWSPRQVVSDDVEAYRVSWLAARPEAMHAAINRLFEVMPPAETYPAVERLVPDRDGGIWIQAYAAPRDTTVTLLRLDGGDLVCRVELPASFEATEGGRDWLLGVSSDSLDVQRVERRRLGPPGG